MTTESVSIAGSGCLSGCVTAMDTVILDGLPEGVVLFTRCGTITRVNKAFAALVQLSQEAILGASCTSFLNPSGIETFRHALRSAESGALGDTHEVIGAGIVAGQLGVQRVDLSITRLVLDNTIGFVLVVRNRRRLQRLQEQLNYQSNHDHMTGLINRWAFLHALSQRVGPESQNKWPVALLILDIDHFRDVNDNYGHGVGDHVLTEVANRIRAALRPDDLLSRFGGDEFAVLVTDLSDPYDASMLASRLMRAIALPYRLQNGEIHPTVSVGIALAPFDAQDAQSLVRYAEIAMYQSKAEGRNTVTRYTPMMAHIMTERMRILERLRQAIGTCDLALHYQPQVDLSTGHVVSVEALLRWTDTELGPMPPDRFIPLAEANGLMPILGNWVLETACAQLAQWRDQGIQVRMAINLSAEQFHYDNLCEFLDHLLEKHHLSPELIELELTESRAMVNPEHALTLMQRLSDRGFQIAIDDFGTGHSSLAYLKTLPIDRVKIDRSFVCDLQPDSPEASLIQGIIQLVHALGKEVVAEGVETDHQLQFLKAQGCNSYQGWFYSKAIPADEFARLVRVV